MLAVPNFRPSLVMKLQYNDKYIVKILSVNSA